MQAPQGHGGGFVGGFQFLLGGPPRGAQARHARPNVAHFGAGLMALNVAPPIMQNHPAPPPPADEPPGLPNGGVIDIACTAIKMESSRGGGMTGRIGDQLGVKGTLREHYDKFVIPSAPDAFSMCAPSEDILLWTAKGGQEIMVVNTRLQMITKIHQFRTAHSPTGIALSKRCALFTNDSGFVLIISPTDKTFRLAYDFELRFVINGQIFRGGHKMPGRSTHLLEDNETIVHLMAQPPLALYFRVSDIKDCVTRNDHTIVPFDVKNLANNLPSMVAGRLEPLESAIMKLRNRILLGCPIMNTDHLEWAWFDVKTREIRTERVHNGPNGQGPQLHPQFLLKLRLNPLNLNEIYVHIINTTGTETPRERRLSKGELWVMGMSTINDTFVWKRRERPPSFDNPDFKQLTQTPMDWTRTPEGTMYIRWVDLEGVGPGDENLTDFRLSRSFTLTRLENTGISPLSSMASRAMQGFDCLSFPLPRPWNRLNPEECPMISNSDRRRASVTGVTTASDFLRYSTALLIHNTSHVYYDDELVYDDTEELIERQRQAITQMTKKTPFRSIFGSLFSNSTRMENPVDDGSGDGGKMKMEEMEDEEEEEEPGPSNRLGRRGRRDSSSEEEKSEEQKEDKMRRNREEQLRRAAAGDRLIDSDEILAMVRNPAALHILMPENAQRAFDAGRAQAAAAAAAAEILRQQEEEEEEEEQAAMMADEEEEGVDIRAEL